MCPLLLQSSFHMMHTYSLQSTCLLIVLHCNPSKCPDVRTVSILPRLSAQAWVKLFRNKLWLLKIVNFCTRCQVEIHELSTQLALHPYQHLVYRHVSNSKNCTTILAIHKFLHIQSDSFTYYIFIYYLIRIPKSSQKMFSLICFKVQSNEWNTSWTTQSIMDFVFNMKNIRHTCLLVPYSLSNIDMIFCWSIFSSCPH